MGKDLEHQIGVSNGAMKEGVSHQVPSLPDAFLDLPRSKSVARRAERILADELAFQSRVAIIEDLAQLGALGEGRSVMRGVKKRRGQ